MTDAKQIPVASRPAATLILLRVRDGLEIPEILMVERSATMAFAAGAAVFPGGGVDAADCAFAEMMAEAGAHDFPMDDAAARIAAIRETLEETGLAIAIQGQKDAQSIADARASLHDGATFAAICAAQRWVLRLDLLVPWARWEPPVEAKRRYDTRFYIADATHVRQDGIADASENRHLFWASAQRIIARDMADELHVIFPTRRNLDRLALFKTFADAADHARAFPVRTIVTYKGEFPDGPHICIPDGHGYPTLSEPMASAKRG
jgi:8-oxo-dGTP pyrophosphatase MutT (NUDIX family)